MSSTTEYSQVLGTDRALWVRLVLEGDMEDMGMHPDERESCHTHQAWVKDCTPLHQSTPLY